MVQEIILFFFQVTRETSQVHYGVIGNEEVQDGPHVFAGIHNGTIISGLDILA